MNQILVSHQWPNNARLLTDAVFPILRTSGLWHDDDTALDVTYHTGVWWADYRPKNFTYHSRIDTPEFDFRSLPYEDSAFDLVAFDPPYIAKGGPSKSEGFDGRFDQRYGVSERIRPDDLLTMNNDGLRESIRVAKNVVLMKSMDFVSEGVLHCHTSALENTAREQGWKVYERFIHVPVGARPQPHNKRVLRGRSRPSTLTILVPDRLKRGYAKRMAPLTAPK
jgi:hypothetical protein